LVYQFSEQIVINLSKPRHAETAGSFDGVCAHSLVTSRVPQQTCNCLCHGVDEINATCLMGHENASAFLRIVTEYAWYLTNVSCHNGLARLETLYQKKRKGLPAKGAGKDGQVEAPKITRGIVHVAEENDPVEGTVNVA
jgi:hypothetical protein